MLLGSTLQLSPRRHLRIVGMLGSEPWSILLPFRAGGGKKRPGVPTRSTTGPLLPQTVWRLIGE